MADNRAFAMKPWLVTKWSTAGFLGVAALAMVWLPILSEAAAPGEQYIPDGPPTGASTDDGPRPTISPSLQAIPAVEAALNTSARSAAAASYCQRGVSGLDEAREHIHYRRYDDADNLLAILLDDDCLEDAEQRDMARFQHAYLSHLLERPHTVLQRLDALESSVPIEDYVHWLRGHALRDLERHQEAAEAFAAIYDADDSPLHWKARALQSKSLVDAQKWEQARPIVEQIIDLFPDYPRRHLALFNHGKILENLGEHEAAARAYQKANFEFPYKNEGQIAGERLQSYAEEGIEPSPIDPRKRFAHYRQLSIDKFWPLAHELMTELREEVATEDGNSRFENEILQRIALNTYHSHDFEGAAEYFAKARQIYEDGHRAGFNKRTIYRFHNFALARIGRFDEAEEVLEKLYENSARRTRQRAIAQFYERYGRYEEAYELFEQSYSAGQQRGWHFSYLKYKTGRFEEAYENLRRLARRSRGETRAKYLYWAARSLERAGNDADAATLFAELNQTRPNSYYGVQAANRLVDLEQRQILDDSFLAQADRVTESSGQVLDAFDEIDRLGVMQARYSGVDPRTQPLGEALAGQSVNRMWDQELLAALSNEECPRADRCSPKGLGLPFPTYGLTWNLDQPLLDSRMGGGISPATTHTGWDSDQEETIEGLDHRSQADPRIPYRDVEFADQDVARIRFNTDARIYWSGRHESDVEFVRYQQGDMIGPVPTEWTAYDDDTHHGGMERAVEQAGDLFPELHRVYWLWLAGWYTEARRVMRDVSLEYRGLSRRARPSSSPHQLSHRRWAYYIDNRRRSQRADYWGMKDRELRYPVPDDRDERQALLERQREIHAQRTELRPVILEAMQEVGDYHFVRRFALDDTWWLRQDPEGEAHRYWKMAYPRAFPEQVIPLAEKHNVNPYMIWALMLVESSFNPDSISVADALGLLQVIPRTGLKIADLFGSEDFGPFDLLEADHSIEQGIFYFSRLVEKFHGQELMAFAGYNGGPHRVSGWLDMRGRNIPLDEFVEEIPFDQSRGYAKKVLRFLHVYLRLYEDYDEGLYVGQNVRPDYLEQPNF